MEMVFVLLPLALLVVAVMLALFIWAVRSGQFDDLETPAVRMLLDAPRTKKRPSHPPTASAPSAPNDAPPGDAETATPNAPSSQPEE